MADKDLETLDENNSSLAETREAEVEEREVEGEERVAEKKEKEFEFDLGEFKNVQVDDEEKFGVKDIVKKYPKIFDDFPALRANYFKAKQFLDIFPSLDAAKEAKDGAAGLNAIEREIFDDKDVKGLLGRIKKNDEKVFNEIARKFLPAIKELSSDIHLDIALSVIDELIIGLNNAGIQRNDDNIKNAALLVNMYVHSTKTLPDGTKREIKEVEKTDDKLERERAQFYQEKLQTAQRTVLQKADTSLSANLDKLISKDKIKNSFMRSKVIEEIKSRVTASLSDDDIHVQNIRGLWAKASRAGFAETNISEIIGTILRKMSVNLPKIAAKVQEEVVGTSVETAVDKNEDPDNGDETTPVNAREIDWDRTSDVDFLAGKITYRKKG